MVWGLVGKAQRLMNRGETSVAAEILRRRIGEEERVNPRHMNLLGICEVKLGHREMAREIFGEVLASYPRNAAALTNMGNLAFLDGDGQAAGDYYTRALRENAFLKEPRHNLVSLYQDMGHFEKALTAYEEYAFMAKAGRWSSALVALLFLLLLMLLVRR